MYSCIDVILKLDHLWSGRLLHIAWNRSHVMSSNWEVSLATTGKFGIYFYLHANLVAKIKATIYIFAPDWWFQIGMNIIISTVFDKTVLWGYLGTFDIKKLHLIGLLALPYDHYVLNSLWSWYVYYIHKGELLDLWLLREFTRQFRNKYLHITKYNVHCISRKLVNAKLISI